MKYLRQNKNYSVCGCLSLKNCVKGAFKDQNQSTNHTEGGAPRAQAHSQVLRFGGAKYIFMRARFLFLLCV